MKFEASLTYPGTYERVSAMLTDPEYQRERLDLPSSSVTLVNTSVRNDEEQFLALTQARVETEEIGQKLPSFIPSSLDVTFVEAWEWDGDRLIHDTISVDITGVPFRMTASSNLHDEGDEVRREVTGNVTASIPLVGAIVEREIVSRMSDVLHSEEEHARAYLSRHME